MNRRTFLLSLLLLPLAARAGLRQGTWVEGSMLKDRLVGATGVLVNDEGPNLSREQNRFYTTIDFRDTERFSSVLLSRGGPHDTFYPKMTPDGKHPLGGLQFDDGDGHFTGWRGMSGTLFLAGPPPSVVSIRDAELVSIVTPVDWDDLGAEENRHPSVLYILSYYQVI